MDDALDSTGLWLINEYIQRRQGRIAAQVACRPIYELCTGAERIPGSSQMMRRWDQDVVREEE